MKIFRENELNQEKLGKTRKPGISLCVIFDLMAIVKHFVFQKKTGH